MNVDVQRRYKRMDLIWWKQMVRLFSIQRWSVRWSVEVRRISQFTVTVKLTSPWYRVSDITTLHHYGNITTTTTTTVIIIIIIVMIAAVILSESVVALLRWSWCGMVLIPLLQQPLLSDASLVFFHRRPPGSLQWIWLVTMVSSGSYLSEFCNRF